MPKAQIEGGELYYETHGSGTPLLLVSGLGGIANYWLPNIPALSKTHQVVVHDHRGTGQSTRSNIRYSVDQMTDDVIDLMDHLKIEKTHLVGHSTGGAIGQTMAVRHPERLISLTISASWPKADAFFRRVFEARRALLMNAGPAAYVRSTPVFLYPDWWINENIGLIEEREKPAITNFPPVEIVASRIDAIMAFDRTADLPRIKTPTMLLCARDDILTPSYYSRELARLISGVEFVQLERGGHCASEVDPATFERTILNFTGRYE
jgi:aminoacrylate hydrolase